MAQVPRNGTPAASKYPEIIAWAMYFVSTGCRSNGYDPHKEYDNSADVDFGFEKCGVESI